MMGDFQRSVNCIKSTAEYVGETVSEIGQYLFQFRQKFGGLFLDHSVAYLHICK